MDELSSTAMSGIISINTWEVYEGYTIPGSLAMLRQCVNVGVLSDREKTSNLFSLG